jgi:hypothetical protein
MRRLLVPMLYTSLTVMILGAAQVFAQFYDPGVSPPPTAGHVFGDHLVAPQSHPSVAGSGGGGLSDAGDVLDGARTYIYDFAGQADLTDGVADRGDTDFAMMIWDMGAPFNSMRLYTHQDHYSGGPITDNFTGQDVMEYSVWGSHDGDNFVLLSDVLAFDLNGGGAGLPTYTFAGTAPSIVYRGGSTEFGILNAYTREYVFPTDFRYYGIDPEIDAIAGFHTIVPEPCSGVLLSICLLGAVAGRWRKRATL